jgi:hypothetical protein
LSSIWNYKHYETTFQELTCSCLLVKGDTYSVGSLQWLRLALSKDPPE